MPGLRTITKLFDSVRIHVLFASREYGSNDVVEMAVQIVTRDRFEILAASAELIWRGRDESGSKREIIQSSKPFGGRQMLRAGSDDSFEVDLATGSLSSVATSGGRWKTRVRIVGADRRKYSCENRIKITTRGAMPRAVRSD